MVAAYARMQLQSVSGLARLVFERPLALQEWKPAAVTRVFVSFPSYLSVMGSPSLASRSWPIQAAEKTFEQAWLVRRAPIHSVQAVALRSDSRRVSGPDRLVALLRSFAGTPRSAAQWAHVPVT